MNKSPICFPFGVYVGNEMCVEVRVAVGVDAGVGDEGAADLWGGPAADPVSPNIPAAGIGVHGSPDSCDASATGRSSNTHFCAGPARR